MRYLGTISDDKDLVTKEYVDNHGGGGAPGSDTINITTFSSGWDIYSNAWTVTLRRYGRVISLTGALRNTSSITINTTPRTVFNLPSSWSAYFPAQETNVLCHGSNTCKYLLRVNPTGEVTIERYTSGTTYPSIDSGYWFPFHTTWIAAGIDAPGQSLLDLVYPVGSIYTSVNSVSPQTLFGGVWVKLEDRFLLGAGTSYTAGDTGGSEYIQEHGHDHTNPSVTGGSCTITSSGGHSHTITSHYKGNNAASGSARNTPNTGASSATNLATIASNTGTHTHSVPSHTHTVSGGSIDDVNGVQTGNEGNMPPYLVVNMWKRTQ